MSTKYTPNYGIIDYSKHIWLVDTPHAEKIYQQPNTPAYDEVKKDEHYLKTMSERGQWMIDEITVKGRYMNFTITYFIDNYLNVYVQRNQNDLYSPPFKTCPKNVTNHTCFPDAEQCYCKSSGLYAGFEGYTGRIYPMSDEMIEFVKSGTWVLSADTTRPRILHHYVGAYMENKALSAEVEAMKAECALVHTNYTALENELRNVLNDAEAANNELMALRIKATRECDELRQELQAYDEEMTERLATANADHDSLMQHSVWLQDELKKSQTQFNLIRPLNAILNQVIGVQPRESIFELIMFLLSPVIALWIVLMNLVPRRELL
jgi:hypothetical protein